MYNQGLAHPHSLGDKLHLLLQAKTQTPWDSDSDSTSLHILNTFYV